MIIVRVVTAALFVCCSSAFFYGVEKYLLNAPVKISTHLVKENSVELCFCITNDLNVGVSNAIVYVSAEAITDGFKAVHLSDVSGETVFTELSAGVYCWKVISTDSQSVLSTGKIKINTDETKQRSIRVYLGKALGSFEQVKH